MAAPTLHRFRTISEFHEFRGLPGSEHPLVSVIDMEAVRRHPNHDISLVHDFYSISLKRSFNAKIRYGQQQYDFDEGVMFFIGPGQVYSIGPVGDQPLRPTGWMLLIHPDFLWNTSLAAGIKKYDYFDYAVHEALFLSEKEELIVSGIIRNIEQEYKGNIDNFSQDIIIAQLEVLLSYSERFYHRQFLTRKVTNHKLLDRLEALLDDYFEKELPEKGLPTVQYVAAQLNVSPNYLSGLLKVLTGKSTQHHIQDKLIERAKEQLSTTELSVSEIAYSLGFEHPQSFSKLFRSKTQLSPLQFRQSFN